MVGSGPWCCHRGLRAVDCINPFGDVETQGGVRLSCQSDRARSNVQSLCSWPRSLCVVVSVSAGWCPRENDAPEGYRRKQAECQSLRVWRRNLGRSCELGVQLPDALVLVRVLTKLGRLGGPQLVCRLATFRQDLKLDFLPPNTKVTEFVEALQAEAEQLALATAPSSMTSTMVKAADTKKKEVVKAAALRHGDERRNENGYGQIKASSRP
jgi:hypothetical protein